MTAIETPGQPAAPEQAQEGAGEPPESPAAGRGRGEANAQRLVGGLRLLWFAGLVAFGVQLILLLVHTAYLWHHFDLTSDFGQYGQAWQQIATGHLNPYDTTYPWNYPHYGYPFYQADLELILWPLSLLYWIYPHAIDLLVVQDLALAGAGLVAFRWSLEHLQRHTPARRFAVVVGATVLALLLIQPWTYWANSYDYHSEPLATFFILLAGRDLWAGRRRGWWWIVLVLLCGNVAASYVAALGVAALLCGRRRLRQGLVLLVVAAAWLAVVGLVHSGKGAALSAYAYLADRTTLNDSIGGILLIAAGMVLHPHRVWHMVSSRWADINKFVAGVGTIGVFSAVGAPFAIVVLTPSALNSSPGFISAVGGSQNIMAVMACAVGVAFLATWVWQRAHGRSRRWRVAVLAVTGALLAVTLVQSVATSLYWTPRAGQTFERVDGAAASVLDRLSRRIPEGDEVIVSQGVSGRFGERRDFYPYFDVYANGQTVPLFGRTVYAVFVPHQGVPSATPQGTMAAVALLRHLGAHEIAAGPDVYAFAWHVPHRQRTITFPP